MHTFMGDTPIVTLILVFKAHHYSAHLPYRCVKHTYILKGVQNTPLWVAHQWCAVALVCIAHPDFYSVCFIPIATQIEEYKAKISARYYSWLVTVAIGKHWPVTSLS